MKKITIQINQGPQRQIQPGLTIRELLQKYDSDHQSLEYIAVKNNLFACLNETITENSTIGTYTRFFESSRRAYENTAVIMLQYVMERYLRDKKLSILHSMADGVYCEINQGEPLPAGAIKTLKSGFAELVSADIPIIPKLCTKEEATRYFRQNNRPDTADLLKYCSLNYLMLYELKRRCYWLPSPPAPSTSLINTYDILKYKRGFVLRIPTESKPGELQPFYNQQRLYEIFNEAERWGQILELSNICQLNDLIASNSISDIIKISEALHEKKIAAIADKIDHTHQDKRLIFVAGPSSSGKTTFMKRLYIQLRVLGHKVISISLDNYFKDRDELTREQGGNLDYEVLEALDLKLLNDHLGQLLKGKAVVPPVYDFVSGKKTPAKGEIRSDKNTFFIIEGIHGINPGLAESIDDRYKFKIYLSALTHLNFDDTNRIPTHDTRLIRRIVRDAKYRGYSAADTIKMWKKVVEGEKRYIFRFQGTANIMFNSSLAYELCALKQPAEIALKQVDSNDQSHPESERLLSLLAYFLPIDIKEIPPNSILREFIGESSFSYH